MDSASSHSPLLYRNLSNILTAKGQLYSAQKLHFKMMDTVDWVLGKASRFSEWKEIFTESNYCKNCGSLEYNFILQRPDGQSIVAVKIGFAFLQFIPKSSNIHKLYNKIIMAMKKFMVIGVAIIRKKSPICFCQD